MGFLTPTRVAKRPRSARLGEGGGPSPTRRGAGPPPPGPFPHPGAPPSPRTAPQERDHPGAVARGPAGPAHPGAGGASSSSQSKSGPPRSARVRRRLRARAPQAASQEEASTRRRLSPASSARGSILRPPAHANSGTSLPRLVFPPVRREVKKHSDFRLGGLQFQDPRLLVQWGKDQAPEIRMRAPASLGNAVPNLPGTGSRTEHAPGRRHGHRSCAQARGSQAAFSTSFRGKSRRCGRGVSGRPGGSVL